jgi:hypothetical protein
VGRADPDLLRERPLTHLLGSEESSDFLHEIAIAAFNHRDKYPRVWQGALLIFGDHMVINADGGHGDKTESVRTSG